MSSQELVALIHLVGFVTGVILYGMLAVMTWRESRARLAGRPGALPVMAALLGLLWNAVALVVFGRSDFGFGEVGSWLTAISYSALGFLPAVVVDSATRVPERPTRPSVVAICAYVLSTGATALQVASVLTRDAISTNALLALTLGYGAIIVMLAVTTRRRTGSQRTITAVALAAFAVSALHLSRHSAASDSWPVELIGHHASLPLVLVILYQDFRFAFADLFLKRTLAIIALAAVGLTSYALAIVPLLDTGVVQADRLRASVFMLWLATALLYPWLRRLVEQFVDRVILGRSDYRELRATIVREVSKSTTVEQTLDVVCTQLGPALTAQQLTWQEFLPIAPPGHEGTLVDIQSGVGATITIPTSEQPAFLLRIRELARGRRLLSDDVALLDAVALLVGRRIDELRMEQERLQRNVRESEIQRLAAEAELRALRAQLNPHFLFNALTTIGFLIRTSPTRALDTLYQLTSLLRAVLRRTTGDFVALADELHIVEAYLAIEGARFEERLQVERNVPTELEQLHVPPLILQPIVENAVKHGIAPLRDGGKITISAELEARETNGQAGSVLRLTIADTGVGATDDEFARRRHSGVGLTNVERRLEHYFGSSASLAVSSAPGSGTRVELIIPSTFQAHDRTMPGNHKVIQ